MYQVQPLPEPTWRDVASGIRFKFRHAPTEALAAGRRAARKTVAEDPQADAYVAFVIGAATWGVSDWEGLGAEGTEGPVAPTAELMNALLRQRPDIYEAVDDFYVGPLMELLSEKNG